MSVNKVILIGNIGRDVEVRHAPGGVAVAKFSLATNEVRKDKNGQRQEQTEWHNIVAFGQARGVLRAATSARAARSTWRARIRTRTYDDEKGNRRYFTEIIAQTIQLRRPETHRRRAGRTGRAGGGEAPEFPPEGEEDIPF